MNDSSSNASRLAFLKTIYRKSTNGTFPKKERMELWCLTKIYESINILDCVYFSTKLPFVCIYLFLHDKAQRRLITQPHLKNTPSLQIKSKEKASQFGKPENFDEASEASTEFKCSLPKQEMTEILHREGEFNGTMLMTVIIVYVCN